MSISTKSLLELLTLNLTTEQMAAVLRVIALELKPVEQMRLEQDRINALRRDRNNRYYLSKRLNSVLQDAESDAIKTKIKISPPFPSFSPIPPITTLPPPFQTNIHTASENLEFNLFKTAYPKRAGNADWKAAQKAWNAAIKREAPENVINKAFAYSAWCKHTDKFGTEFVKQARSWLNSDGWNENYELTPQRISQNGTYQTRNNLSDSFAIVNAAIAEAERREIEAGITKHSENVESVPRLRQITT